MLFANAGVNYIPVARFLGENEIDHVTERSGRDIASRNRDDEIESAIALAVGIDMTIENTGIAAETVKAAVEATRAIQTVTGIVAKNNLLLLVSCYWLFTATSLLLIQRYE